MSDADVLVVGAGIAGSSAAWFAARAGRAVTIVDEAIPAAPPLPVALVNPLRGHAGRLVTGGVDGMHATFALVDVLVDCGHAIAHGRGLHRPLIDRDADRFGEAFWHARLDGVLVHDWHPEAPAALGLAEPVPSLFLRDAGWVAPRDLLDALSAETPAVRIAARVARVDPQGVVLSDGTRIGARAVVWCAGARGAAGLDDDASDDIRDGVHDDIRDGLYRPGSLVVARTLVTRAPLTFGLYAVPIDGATVIGPTREGSTASPVDGPVAASAVRHLEDRVAATFGTTIALEPLWRGVRLVRLSTTAARALAGVHTLTALGSRGFLMAPWLAQRWARSL